MSNPSPATKFSAHIGFLFSEIPFEERFSAARKAGFHAVEHPFPYRTPADHVARLLKENGLVLVQTGFPAGDASKGEKGLAAIRDRRSEFRDTVRPTIEYANEIGCGMLHVMAGVVAPGASREEMWEEYLENLAFAADLAKTQGLDVLVEPIGPGTVADYLIDKTDLAVRAIDTLGRRNVKLLFDVFHAVSMGTEPESFIAAHAAKIGHVQIADHPGRHEPGSGGLDFDTVFAALSKAGYAGYVGCEYHPSGSTVQSFGWMDKLKGDGR